jgi:hypothetical protein
MSSTHARHTDSFDRNCVWLNLTFMSITELITGAVIRAVKNNELQKGKEVRRGTRGSSLCDLLSTAPWRLIAEWKGETDFTFSVAQTAQPLDMSPCGYRRRQGLCLVQKNILPLLAMDYRPRNISTLINVLIINTNIVILYTVVKC